MFTKLTKKENRWAWILTGVIIAVMILFAQNASALVSYSPVAQIGTGDINSAMILNNTLLPEDLNTSVSSTWLFNNDIIVNRNSTTTGNHTVSKNLIVSGNTTLATTTLATTTISNLTVTTGTATFATTTLATTTITNLTVTNCTGCGNSSVLVPAIQFATSTNQDYTPPYVNYITANATSTFYVMVDNVTSGFSVSAIVPLGKTSISSIKILYSQTSTGNLKLYYRSSYVGTTYPTSPTIDAIGEVVAGGGTNGNINTITVTPTAYDNISSVTGNGLITLQVQRDSSDAANDTYNANLNVYGVLFTFN
ncbi:MAG: hypothetical protein KGJ58_01690 [Patescibacteria group bacterium]|nr:hypothetical protein [Patescibacteria group bacterium]MDE2218151.1 hypothetical protein [Patescibacteria group bacterium]